MLLPGIILTQLCLLSLSSQAENEVRLFLPTDSNLTRYQQSILRFLSGSQTFQLGVLQLYLNGKWGSVCDDSWSSTDSHVVCSQLNLSYSISYSELPFLRGLEQESPADSPIWLDEVKCVGEERQLAACPSLPPGAHDCTHSEDVNLMCSGINLVGIYQGIIASIIILIISVTICCVCCCCCCCPCCPIARHLRPGIIQSEEDSFQEQVLLKNKDSVILEYLPSPASTTTTNKLELWGAQDPGRI